MNGLCNKCEKRSKCDTARHQGYMFGCGSFVAVDGLDEQTLNDELEREYNAEVSNSVYRL